MSVEYLIICDACSAAVDGNPKSAVAARQIILQDGGRVNLPGGKDLRPDCVKAGKRPE